MNIPTETSGAFELVAHRGALAEAPENSLLAFDVAESLKLAQIETDLRISADGKLFLLHDPHLDRVAEVGEPVADLGPVAELAWQQIRAIRLPQGQRVPLLVELYEVTTTPIQLEIKAPEALPSLARFFAARPQAAARTMITSFSAAALVTAAELLPELPRGRIVSRFTQALEADGGPLALLAQSRASHLMSGVEGLTADWVARLAEADHPMHVWPLRTADDLDQAIALGATGGTTDDPRAFTQLLAERGLRPRP